MGRYLEVRAQSLSLADGLSDADCQVQSMADASPVKWHLAHVTWFFETFVLEPFEPHFEPHVAAYRTLFNSYYQAVGERHPRPQRGLLTRPSLAEVRAWRLAVDERVTALLQAAPTPEVLRRVELGLQHEQQHQELLLTDLLHLFSCNPLAPVYRARPLQAPVSPVALRWVAQPGGLADIGHAGAGFSFDNEGPRHRVWLQPHALANRLVTQGEWAAFMADGGYEDPRWWLAAGWDWVQQQGIGAPLHWRREGGGPWQVYTLHGLLPLEAERPVVHISLYEADAHARWAAAQHGLPLRLPTEAEWEAAAAPVAAAAIASAHAVEDGVLHPLAAARTQQLAQVPGRESAELLQLFGEVWQWTRSAYLPYPGFRASEGALGEYNGKFMVDQTVLRGSSCATPRAHMRASYRNFFPSTARWQFNGLRLACDLQ